MRRAAGSCLLTVFLFASCGGDSGRDSQLAELSGVERSGQSLLLVTDDSPGTYYVVPFDPSVRGAAPLALDDVRAVPMPGGDGFSDLEDIAMLADQRIAILSEAECAVLLSDGLTIHYPHEVDEFANRGLEGLDVTAIDGRTMVAVAWEGGYPLRRKMPSGQERSHEWMTPRLLIHELPSESVRFTMDDVEEVQLQVPMLPGTEPEVQRFRVPAVLWHRWADETGFILLLNSENAASPPVYAHVWLQRVTRDGQLVGEPVDIADVAPPSIATANWEGMCWLERGRSVLLVHDRSDNIEVRTNDALAVELPADWQ